MALEMPTKSHLRTILRISKSAATRKVKIAAESALDGDLGEEEITLDSDSPDPDGKIGLLDPSVVPVTPNSRFVSGMNSPLVRNSQLHRHSRSSYRYILIHPICPSPDVELRDPFE